MTILSKVNYMATAQLCVAGKQPFRIKFGMTGVLSPTLKNGFGSFVSFVKMNK